MDVLLIFLVTTGAALGVLILRRRHVLREAVPLALRIGLAALFLITGASHFVALRGDLVAMVPPALPHPEFLVTVTGVLELAGAVGLLVRRTSAWAAGGLAALLVVMFPANVYAATAGLTLGGEPATALVPRAAMQAVYLASALIVARAQWRHAVRREAPDARRMARRPGLRAR